MQNPKAPIQFMHTPPSCEAFTPYCWKESPVGSLLIIGTGHAPCSISHIVFCSDGRNGIPLNTELPAELHGGQLIEDAQALQAATDWLDRYFSGKAMEIADLRMPLSPSGGEFSLKVWGALTQIPHGQTASYGEIAKHIGSSGAARAVGLANGKNPIPVMIPCHRVIGANGKLVGFTGGMERKIKLLEIESQAHGLFADH